MAKARETAPDPPVQSEDESGEEEEEEESSSEEENEGSEPDSESEPEPPQTQSFENAKKASSTPAQAPNKAEPVTPKTQPSAAASSSEEEEDEESGSETDSDSPPKKPDPSIKPIASKPMDDPQKSSTTKKPRSKPNPSGPTSPTKPTTGAGAKRAAPVTSAMGGDEAKDTKRSKRQSEAEAENSEKKGNSTDDSKKLFQRLWSEDDEIAILKGMIDYSAKKKVDPVTDLNAFLEFIKKNLHIDVSRAQLQNKIRRLRKKYENIASKEKKGKERIFSKDHEQKAYDLSKKIWGTEKNGREEAIETPKVNGTPVRKSRSRSAAGTTPKLDELEEQVKEESNSVDEKNVEELKKSVSFVPDSSGIEGWVLTNGTEFMKEEKRVEMGGKWKELRIKETEFFARKLELMLEQTKLILDGLKSSGH